MSKDNAQRESRHQIWILLDGSGSMSRLERAVVDGTNEFIKEQQSGAGHCRLTVAQFDTVDPFELIVEGIRIEQMRPLRYDQYHARATTPLYDAIGTLIERVDQRVDWCKRHNRPEEEQTVLIFTDGLENASQRFDQPTIFKLISERQQAGWTFVFMGANQDSYAIGRGLGIDRRGIQNFDAVEQNLRTLYRSSSRAMLSHRLKAAGLTADERGDFFEGVREAEEEMQRPQKSGRR